MVILVAGLLCAIPLKDLALLEPISEVAFFVPDMLVRYIYLCDIYTLNMGYN